MRALFAHGERVGQAGTAFDWSADAITTSTVRAEAEGRRAAMR
jgi:hypothetical protein